MKNMKKMKNSVFTYFFKTLFIILLLAIPFYILYLDNNLLFNKLLPSKSFIDETLFKSENESEGFSLHYKNLCGAKRSNFYDVKPGTVTGGEVRTFNIVKDGSSCSYHCDQEKCDLYTLKNIDSARALGSDLPANAKTCTTYKNLDSELSVLVNCDNKILSDISGVSELSELSYAGEGFVKPEFYEKNRASFQYKDYLLEKTNEIKSEYQEINSHIQNLGTGETLDTSIYSVVNQKLIDMASYLDISRANLFSNLLPKSSLYNIEETSIKFLGQDISYINMLKKFNNLEKESIHLDGKDQHGDLEINREYLIYTIMLILTIITVLILLLYKLVPDLISDGKLFVYFIGIVILLLFIHFNIT